MKLKIKNKQEWKKYALNTQVWLIDHQQPVFKKTSILDIAQKQKTKFVIFSKWPPAAILDFGSGLNSESDLRQPKVNNLWTFQENPPKHSGDIANKVNTIWNQRWPPAAILDFGSG